MSNIQWKPDYIFEVSWEVCNKVGGIHTVLSTKARLLEKEWGDRLILIGPDLPTGSGPNREFIEDKELFTTWKTHIQQEGLRVRTGRWDIPGQPLAILIDFSPLFQQKNRIFTDLWVKFRLDSLNGQWDYIEPAMFGYAAGIAIAGFYHCHLNATDKIIAQFHEWMTGAGILYLEEHVPQIATVFTTHATVLGRTLAAKGVPLYGSFDTINAEQCAQDAGVVSKHSLEKTAAAVADCFTCVSRQSLHECEQFLGRRPDFITTNGFDASFVPAAPLFIEKRIKARKKLLAVASALLQQPLAEDSLLLIKSGRYEFRNKGIDLFINSLAQLNVPGFGGKNIVAFVFVPAANTGPRQLLLDSLYAPDMSRPRTGEVLTHNLQAQEADPVMQRIRQNRLDNAPGSRVKIIFSPVYLNGFDGIFDLSYYDLLIGFDLAVFPSYYEPFGYTPLESAAFHTPAVTTNVSGFGAAVSELPAYSGEGVYVVERNDGNDAIAATAIAGIIGNYAQKTEAEINAARNAAANISSQFLWDQLLSGYYVAYDFSLQKSRQREALFRDKPQAAPAVITHSHQEQKAVWRNIQVQPMLPPPLDALFKLSANLWYYWNRDARSLFSYIDPAGWERCRQQPIALLKTLHLNTISKLETDKRFLDMLAVANQTFENYMASADRTSPLTAYFCMEYGLHPGLKLYAGGLGILAGDYLKAASDSNMNLVAVGLLYRQGYFKQAISQQGDQLAMPDHMEVDNQPVYQVFDKSGAQMQIQFSFPGRTVYAGVWKIAVGRVDLYLLDTDVNGNNAEDRQITAQLYSADATLRLKQEILLGIGGIRMLEALNIRPAIYHINEGHAAFICLERIRQLIQQEHLDFGEAMEIVRASTQFTTHTALPAAMDLFSEEQLRPYLSYLSQDLNISWNELMSLGRSGSHDGQEPFSMLYLAAKCAQEINGVSQQHKIISCRLLQVLWKDFKPAELHITGITNGVHVSSWLAEPWQKYYSGPGRDNINDIPGNVVWQIRNALKKELVKAIKRSAKNTVHLREDALFIGFARRFAPYKRAGLLFSDMQRLIRMVTNQQRPVQIIFAGKAHPNDAQAISILKTVINNSRIPELQHNILFLENYDMEIAAMLVQGVDVWLNTPQAGKEACGTSGMKAIWNGALHCSIKDGWWAEAYREDAGWAPDSGEIYDNEAMQDQQDAAVLYSMLENDIIPLFFSRNEKGLPEDWINMIKTSISRLAPAFDMLHMVEAYSNCYRKLYTRSTLLQQDHYKQAKELRAWKQKVQAAWNEIHVLSIEHPSGDTPTRTLGETFQARIKIYTGTLTADDIGVEVIFTDKRNPDEYVISETLTISEINGRRATFECHTQLTITGSYAYTFRVFAKHPLIPYRQDFPLVIWI